MNTAVCRSHATRDRGRSTRLAGEQGIAVLIALIALSIFSLISFYLAFGAKTEVTISDNYETQTQAVFAARAGLAHARELIRGLQYNDLLMGPDGTHNSGASYLALARTFAFRNPAPWATARTLDILSPAGSLSSFPDDGLVNTGKYGGTNGTILIPLTGIAETAPNPYGAGTVTTARYFVKVSDNNGEATELAADAANNPFFDGDNIIFVRSMGISQTIGQRVAGSIRRNSVAVVEAKFRMRTTFDLDAPFVVEGPNVVPSRNNLFDGNSFDIDGGAGNPGIATIDTNTADSISLESTLEGSLTKNQVDNISGNCPDPCITDTTGTIVPGSDQELLLNPAYLWDLVYSVIPTFADAVYQGDQHWDSTTVPYLGRYDWTKPPNDITQDPRVTYVNGNLNMQGNISGGGLLVVTGQLSGGGSCIWNGLILVIGQGNLDMSGWNLGVHGGMFVTKLINNGGTIEFGTPLITISGNSNIVIHSDSIRMGMRLIAAEQLGYREIHGMIDP